MTVLKLMARYYVAASAITVLLSIANYTAGWAVAKSDQPWVAGVLPMLGVATLWFLGLAWFYRRARRELQRTQEDLSETKRNTLHPRGQQ